MACRKLIAPHVETLIVLELEAALLIIITAALHHDIALHNGVRGGHRDLREHLFLSLLLLNGHIDN